MADPKADIGHVESSSNYSGVDEKGIIHANEFPEPPADVVDKATEKKLIAKLDKRIVPVIMWMYLMNFMDRVAIGNARLYEMESDLGLTGDQFQIAVSVLFITYCLFEVPSNMVIKKLQPAYFLGGLAVAWGIVATCSALVTNFAGLIACRLLLGVFEAGMFPGIILYLGMFYNRSHIALRVSYFFSVAAVSGAAGGLVGYACGYLEGVNGWHAWRWVLFVNGLPSIATGFVVPFILPNSVDKARFLSPEEKEQIHFIRMNEVGQSASGQELHKADVMKGAKDWTTYVFALCGFCNNIMLYSFSTFLPTIILGFGNWTRPEVQALTIPVYALGAGCFLVMGRVADKTGLRAPLLIPFLLTAILGYILLLTDHNVATSFAGCFLIGAGLYTGTGLPLSWLTSNRPRYGNRAFSSGVQLTVANMAGVPAPFLFATDTGPRFIQGYATTAALLFAGSTMFTVLALYWRSKNKRRDAGLDDWKLEGKTEEEIAEMGDENPRFRYMW